MELDLDERVDLWHDRAVLHFMGSKKEVLEIPRENLSLIEAYNYLYTMPTGGIREFRYMMFRKKVR